MSDITCVLLTASDKGLSVGSEVVLTPEESHHVARVRRKREGDEIWAITGMGDACRCLLRDADPGKARIEVQEVVPQWREPVRNVTLYQGLIRSNRMELIAEQGTAIGMRSMVPIITERVERFSLKLDRLLRIAGETSKQCCRGWIPTIVEPLQWIDFQERVKEPLLLVADSGADLGLADLIQGDQILQYDEIGVVIGPEGGLSGPELDYIIAQGGIGVHLGRRRLRSESAAAVALTLLLIGSEHD
ncbi:RsmE family RNA methyltransferase [Candidatus Zixiibacteriota bacterium]